MTADADIDQRTMPDGIRIAHSRCGQGPTLWQMPHWLGSLAHDPDNPVSAPVRRALGASHTLLRHELRGCGSSTAPGASLGFHAWLADLESLAEALAPPRFALLGQSQGAALAIAYAARHPDRVSRLVLHGGYARGRLARDASPEAAAEVRTMAQMAGLGWDRADAAFRQLFTTQLLPGARRAEQSRFNDAQRAATSGASAARLLLEFDALDVSALLPLVRCPTLVLHSRDDARVPFDEGLALASAIDGAEFVSVASANHLLVDSEPAWPRWVEAVREFLAPEARRCDHDQLRARLSARQVALVELLAQGRCNAQIAQALGVSSKTVRNAMGDVFHRLSVENRGQAIVTARNSGFGLAAA